jgi:predicted ribosomally synthesized peptide with SipW-like signal peptide
MKKTFALVASLAIGIGGSYALLSDSRQASAQQTNLISASCELDGKPSNFKLTVDPRTKSGSFEGQIQLPHPGYSYQFNQIVHIVDDPTYHSYSLQITPPPPGMMYPQVVVEAPIKESIDLSSAKPYVKVIIEHPNARTSQTVICPVPKN